MLHGNFLLQRPVLPFILNHYQGTIRVILVQEGCEEGGENTKVENDSTWAVSSQFSEHGLRELGDDSSCQERIPIGMAQKLDSRRATAQYRSMQFVSPRHFSLMVHDGLHT